MFVRKLLVAVLIGCGTLGQAMAQSPAQALTPLTAAEMGELRGGFYTVDGLTFDFGATIRTLVDGVPVLELTLALTPYGARVGGDPGLPSADLVGFRGVTLMNETGATTILHRLADGQIQGVILNDASGRTIQQDIGVQLLLPSFDIVQSNIDFARNAARLNSDMALGLINSSRS